MTRISMTTASGVAFLGAVALAAVGASKTHTTSPSWAEERAGLQGEPVRLNIADAAAYCNAGIPGLPISACFVPGVSPRVRQQVTQAMMDQWMEANGGAEGGAAFELGNRWSIGGSSLQGTPVNLRWSVIPDGVSIPDAGLGSGPNAVNAKMTAVFGSVENGKVIFRQVFDRWHQLAGIDYTEVNDDGAGWGASGSSARGDCRIAGIPFSTNEVLAYNYFPGTGIGGDMVINTGMNWTPSSNNWRYLRNIMMHEHGHGLGLEHVCPDNQTKLMEPFVSLAYDGPQQDDIRGGQRHYGDPVEPNDTQAAPFQIPNPTGVSTIINCSIDDNADVDWFRFAGTIGMKATVRVTPTGLSSYLSGPETQACNTGTATNSLAVHDLQIQLYRNVGTTLLVTQNVTAAGQLEQITNYVITTNENYYIKVTPVDVVDNIQIYTLMVTLTPGVTGDLNGDGLVDGADLGILLANWSLSGTGDINGDGTTDGADLGILLANWT